MSSKAQRLHPFERRAAFVLSLLLSFIVIFGVASLVAYRACTKAIETTIHSNETRATLLAKLILEHQRAAVGALLSYADRPELVLSVQKRDYEGALKHLTDLAKNNPEMDWPFISNPDSTVWVNYPVDMRVMNRDLSHRDWYQGVSKGWKPYISTVYQLLVGEKDLAVAISVPIFDQRGKIIGILATAQSTGFFRKIIDEVGLNLNAKITLVDQGGHIVYSNRFPYMKEIITYPSLESVSKALKAEKGNVKFRDASDGGRIKYVSFAPIEGIRWSIIVEKTRDEVLQSEVSSLALIGLISVLLNGVVVLFMVHLRERHRQIKTLRELTEELDGRVRERTAELEAGNRALRESEERFRILAAATFEGIAVTEHGRFVDVNEQLVKIIGGTRTELIGQEVAPLVASEDRDRVMACILAGVENRTEHRMFRRDGTPITVETHGRTIAYQNRQVRITAIRDITERKQTEEALRKSEARFRLLSETGGRLLATDNPQRIVEDLCRAVMTHLDCHAFFNFLVDELAGRLRLNACAGIPDEEARKIEWLDYGAAVCGCVAQERVRIIAEDIFHVPDPRTDLVRSYGIQAYCCHPLMTQERLIGTLSFGTKTRARFSPEEVDLMRTVADQVAIAIQRIQAQEALRQNALKLQHLNATLEQRVKERTAELATLSSQLVTAQENERKRVSYDLHDNIWQMLVAIRFEIERLFSGQVEWTALRSKSKQVMTDILGVVGKIRSMQGDLWPYVMDDIGLGATIDWYCREFEKNHTGLAIKRENDLADGEIPPSAEVVIYRILQEALSNVAKHSQARHVTIALMKRDNQTEFTVQDDGIGFDPEETLTRRSPWGGLGLLGIKARTELSGGSFRVESIVGKGTTVQATWPI